MPVSPPHVNNSRPFYTGGFESIIMSEEEGHDVLHALLFVLSESVDGEHVHTVADRLTARLLEIEEFNSVVRKK